MALTDVGAIKLHLAIVGNNEDDLLDHLREEAESGFRMMTGRNLESAQRTRYYSGHGRKTLILDDRPVTAAQVFVDASGYAGQKSGAFAADTEWELGEDFWIRSRDEDERNPGELIAIANCWPEGDGNIKVVQTTGYSTIPAEVVGGIHRLVARMKKDGPMGRVYGSETLGSYAYSLLSGGADDELLTLRNIFAKYRRLC